MLNFPYPMGLAPKKILWIALLGISAWLYAESAAPPAAKTAPPPTLNPAISVNKEFLDLASSQSSEQEILPAPEYLEFSELDVLPEGLIEWSPNSARFLYLNQNELPYVYFMGKLKPGYELIFENQFVQIEKDRSEFSIRVPLQLKPTVFQFRITDPEGKVILFRLINFWLKLPSTFSYKIQTKDGVVEIGKSFYTRFEHSAFAQLYAANRPTSIIDLDAQKFAQLTFRIYAPPQREEVYEGWELEVRDDQENIVGHLKRPGFPPPYVDWRDLRLASIGRGLYSYRVNLFDQGKIFEGALNRFQTIEGHSIIQQDFHPDFSVEPRGELGYFRFSNANGLTYDNQFLAADVSLLFYKHYLVRGCGLTSVHSMSNAASLSQLRGGAGVRLFGDGYGWFGRPYHFRLDLLANYSVVTISPDSSVRRFSTLSVLLEPHFVFWRYHYLTPWIEYGMDPQMVLQKLSAGLGYDFYLRPLSARIGMNVAYDTLLRFSTAPELQFSVFRTSASLTFFL